MEQKTSAINISSHHFIQRIEADIIKLTQTISVEHQIQPDPDAKNIARRMVQLRLNQLLTQEEIDGIKKLKEAIHQHSTRLDDLGYMSKACYELLKMMGLDNV